MDFITGLINGIISLIALIVFFVMAAALANISKNIRNINRILILWEKEKGKTDDPNKININKQLSDKVKYRNKLTGAIGTVSVEYWNDMIKNYGANKFEILE